jgi:hypothetical protein
MNTVEGGHKAKAKLLARDPDYYKKMGAMSRKKGNYKTGFALNPELAKVAGNKGRASRRAKKIV